MAHYLVTGGCGFIGSHLVDMLISKGHIVKVADNLSTGKYTHFHSGNVELVTSDIRNFEVINNVTRNIEGCFHLAAVASVARCNESWHDSHLTNLSSAIALFEIAARERFPVVYASSAAVYGDNKHLPLLESEAVRPRSAYGADKAAAEMHARAGAMVHGLASIGLRFFNVYGPRQQPDSSYSGVISIFLDRIRRRQPLVIHGNGVQSRDFVYVADVASALCLAMERLEQQGDAPCAEVYNVCTGQAVTVAKLARLLTATTGIEVPLQYAPARPGDIRHSTGSPDQAKRGLGFRAAVEIDEGLRHLASDAETA